MNKTIKAILFDLGNVIIKFDLSVLEKEYSAYGKLAEGEFADFMMGAGQDLIDRYMEGKITSSQFYNKTKRMFKLDITFTDFYRIWNSMFYHYPEMEHLVRKIREKYPHVKLVLVSNTNEAHYNYLKENYDILDLLDGMIVSHEFGRQKPDRSIYTEALRLAGSIPKETFYTDDRPELVEAAREMGIRAFHFTGHDEFRAQIAKSGIML